MYVLYVLYNCFYNLFGESFSKEVNLLCNKLYFVANDGMLLVLALGVLFGLRDYLSRKMCWVVCGYQLMQLVFDFGWIAKWTDCSSIIWSGISIFVIVLLTITVFLDG